MIRRFALYDSVPWYYGFCYDETWRRTAVHAIIPLNWIIGFGNRIFWTLYRGLRPSRWQAAIYNAESSSYLRGVEAGRKDALMHICREELLKELLKRF